MYKQLALGELPRSVTTGIAAKQAARRGSTVLNSTMLGKRSDTRRASMQSKDSSSKAGKEGAFDSLTDRDKFGLRTAVSRAKIEAEKLIRKHNVGRPVSAARTAVRPKLSDSAAVIDAAASSPGKLLPTAPLRGYAPGASRAAATSRSKAQDAGQRAQQGRGDVRAVLAALQPTVSDALDGADRHDQEDARLNVLAGAEAQDLPPGAVTEVRR